MDNTMQDSNRSLLQSFFLTCLQELYWAETHLLKMLSSMSMAATNVQLQEIFILHREETGRHKKRLEEVFSQLSLLPQAVPCNGLQGLFDEGWRLIDETEHSSNQRDVALIIAAQKVEHYEIAVYSSLITLAKALGKKEIGDLLAITLEEEKEIDIALTNIAEMEIDEELGHVNNYLGT